MQRFLLTCLAASSLALTSPLHAAATLTLTQDGANVDLTSSGSFDVTDLTLAGSAGSNGGMVSSRPFLVSGSPNIVSVTVYSGTLGSAIFGSGSYVAATSGLGDIFGVNSNTLIVPVGYTSGSALSGTATFANATFSTLGVTPGAYTLHWGTGADADSVTINAVPEPSSWLLLGLGGSGLALAWWRRSRAQLFA